MAEINGAEVLAEILNKWESNGFEGEPSLDGLSAEEKEAVYKYTIDPKAKLNEYGTQIKDALRTDLGDASAAELQAEVDAATPPATDENDDKPADEGDTEEKEDPNEGLEPDDIEYLDSINDENKQKYYNDAQMLDDNEPSLSEFFNKEGKTEEQQADLDSLNKYFENVSAQKEDDQKDPEFKQKLFDAAVLNAHRDLLKDKTLFNEERAAIDAEILRKKQDKEELTDEEKAREAEIKKALQEKIAEHMQTLGVAMAANQVGLETIANIVDREEDEAAKAVKKKELEDILKSGTYIDADGQEKKAVTPGDWQTLLDSLDKDGTVKAGERLQGVMTGDQKLTICKENFAGSMAAATEAPKKFFDRFAEKTGFKKLQDKYKQFDQNMTKSHPKLWRIAKVAGKVIKSKAKFALIGVTIGQPAVVAYGCYLGCKGMYSAWKNAGKNYQDENGEKPSFMKRIKSMGIKDWGQMALSAGGVYLSTLGIDMDGMKELSNYGIVGEIADHVSRTGFSAENVADGFDFGQTMSAIDRLGPNFEAGMDWKYTISTALQRTAPAFAGRMVDVIDKFNHQGKKAGWKELGDAAIDIGATLLINGVLSAGSPYAADRNPGNEDVMGNSARDSDERPSPLAPEPEKSTDIFQEKTTYDAVTGEARTEVVDVYDYHDPLTQQVEQMGQERYDMNHDSQSPYAPGQHPDGYQATPETQEETEERHEAEAKVEEQAKAAEEQAKAAEEQAKAEQAHQHQQSEDKQLEDKIRKDWEDAVKQSEEAIKNGEIGPAPEPVKAAELETEIESHVERPAGVVLGADEKEVFRAEASDGSKVVASESSNGVKYESTNADGSSESREVILTHDSKGDANGYFGIAESRDADGNVTETRNMSRDEVDTVVANYQHISDHGDASGKALDDIKEQVEQGNHRNMHTYATEHLNEASQAALTEQLTTTHHMTNPQPIQSHVEHVYAYADDKGVSMTATQDLEVEHPLPNHTALAIDKNTTISMSVDAQGHSVAILTDAEGSHTITPEEFKAVEGWAAKALPQEAIDNQYAAAAHAYRIDHPETYNEEAAKALGTDKLQTVAVPEGNGVAAVSDKGISAAYRDGTTKVALIGQDGKIHVYAQTPGEAFRGYSLDNTPEHAGMPGTPLPEAEAKQFVQDAVKVYEKAGNGDAAFVNAARDHGWLTQEQPQQQQQATGNDKPAAPNAAVQKAMKDEIFRADR